VAKWGRGVLYLSHHALRRAWERHISHKDKKYEKFFARFIWGEVFPLLDGSDDVYIEFHLDVENSDSEEVVPAVAHENEKQEEGDEFVFDIITFLPINASVKKGPPWFKFWVEEIFYPKLEETNLLSGQV